MENRVLLVDDSRLYRHLVTRYLESWGFDVSIATNGLEAWQILQQPESPTVVLLDWEMPGMNGVELCRKLRERDPSEAYIYTILLTAKEGQANLLSAMEAGIDDYLVKPFEEGELKARLLVGQRIARLQRELITARESMRNAATYDPLTGLLNRREIIARLRQELAKAKRDKSSVSIILADIDFFKAVNDELGHLVGDEVLREVGRRLQSGLRSYDSVGRYGGEEFLLVIPGCGPGPGFERADQIRASVAATTVDTSAASRKVTLSMGIVVANGHNQPDLELLLQQADLGLYKAKRNGRNRVENIGECESSTPAPPGP
ncbi:MAG TPA: diguanylate cyclase [Candidatus Saccharimonadales bacterium]|nr:diguanylate cyclase [Candidatus Saccharimonadales bacterium]